MTSHLCNYNITEMPKQKIPSRNKAPELHEQFFSEERIAQVKDLEQKADLIKNDAKKLLQTKIKRKREQKAATQEKKYKKKKKKNFTSENWRD